MSDGGRYIPKDEWKALPRERRREIDRWGRFIPREDRHGFIKGVAWWLFYMACLGSLIVLSIVIAAGVKVLARPYTAGGYAWGALGAGLGVGLSVLCLAVLFWLVKTDRL